MSKSPIKITVLDGASLNPGDLSWAELEALGTVSLYKFTHPQEIEERIRSADAVLTNRVQLGKTELSRAANLRYVGILATGCNVVDLSVARELGITVTNVPSYSTGAVAQSVMALLLEISNRTAFHDALVKRGEWYRPGGFDYSKTKTFELRGKTMGIIGMGEIGFAVARLAASFGMRVLGCRRTPDPSAETESIRNADLETVLRESDVISLHCPITEQTRGLIGREAIAKMKDGAILINTARGAIVDSAAVCEALDSGKLYMAAVDVVAEDPPTKPDPILEHPRCIGTPHIAWAAVETRRRLISNAADNLRMFLAGDAQNVVNR